MKFILRVVPDQSTRGHLNVHLEISSVKVENFGLIVLLEGLSEYPYTILYKSNQQFKSFDN